MADTHETVIVPPRGSIKVIGKAHGALNTVVSPADGTQWYFQQFISPKDFYTFARLYGLTMLGELPNDSENDHGA